MVGGRGGGGGAGAGAGALTGAADADGPALGADDPATVECPGVVVAGTLGEAAAPEMTAGGVYGAARRIDGSGKSAGLWRPKLRSTSFADSEINTSL